MNTVYYVCGADFLHEMDEGLGDYFTNVMDLKKAKPCWKECGIVKIVLDSAGKLVEHEWISQ